MKMTVDEIKDKIKLTTPYGRSPYLRSFKQKQMRERVENFEKDWRNHMYKPEHVESFMWEFNNRQLGRTTDMLIEALSQMSEGKIVRINTPQSHATGSAHESKRILPTARHFYALRCDP